MSYANLREAIQELFVPIIESPGFRKLSASIFATVASFNLTDVLQWVTAIVGIVSGIAAFRSFLYTTRAAKLKIEHYKKLKGDA